MPKVTLLDEYAFIGGIYKGIDYCFSSIQPDMKLAVYAYIRKFIE